MRKHYIDNIRTICILFLFPYHTFMMYNSFDSFYIHEREVSCLNDFIVVNWVWLMPIMFTIAGISSFFSLKNRSAKKYTKERVSRLLIPLISGILLIIPVQTFFAEKYHNNYEGSYFEQYILFFTKKTNLTGYAGGFTPGQLWFIAYLFVISMIALPVMLWYNKSAKKLNGANMTMAKIIPMFIIPLAASLILNIAGKSVGEYFALFMLGFIVLSNEEVLERLEKNRRWLAGTSAALLILSLVLIHAFGINGSPFVGIFNRLAMWITILAILAVGKRHLNFSNRVTDYLNKAAFPIYVFHQSWLVAVGYYVVKLTDIIAIQIILIMTISFLLTILTYEIFKRIPLTKFLFGIK